MKNLFSLRAVALLLGASLMIGAMTSPADAQRRREQRPLPPVGEPGKVAAADIGFARAAREDGQWTAFRQFAANGAIMHGENGPIEAGPWLAAQKDPDKSVQWGPNSVWSSCDGSLAVTFGRFETAEGLFGSYTTVWELQSDREYKWVYDVGAVDDPQPPAPPELPEDDEDTIIVSGLAIIDGKVADCRSSEAPLPPTRVFAGAGDAQRGGGVSRDSTLMWRWVHATDGTRSIEVDYVREGTWQQAMEFSIPPQAGD
jgi:hypothetical protein